SRCCSRQRRPVLRPVEPANPCEPMGSRRFAWRSDAGAASMPLVRYFITVGAALVALLLLVTLSLEPHQATNAKPQSAGEVASPPMPASQQTVGVTRTPPSAPDPYSLRRPEPTPLPALEQQTQPTSVTETKPKRKSAQVRTRTPDFDDPWRRFGAQPAYPGPASSDTRYDSRAGLRSPRSSSAQGTLGPH